MSDSSIAATLDDNESEVAPESEASSESGSVPAPNPLIAIWGVLGVTLLLSQAIYRLTPVALEPWLEGSLSVGQMLLCGAWVVVNAYAEGYRAFQKRFCPRVVGRAFHLASHPRPLWVLVAPVFCMSFFHATRRTRIIAWVFPILLVGVILLVRALPQPWRGIIDAGVVVGLAWGVICLLTLLVKGLMGSPAPAPDLPPDEVE